MNLIGLDREPRSGALRLDGLTKRFAARGESVVAVDGVSLDIAPGEFITLLGPSGCGKTTTLRIVAGFERATAGGVYLDGVRIDAVPPQQRSMAMVFQSYALFPHMTVYENIAYGLRLRDHTKAEIAEAVKIALTSMNLVGKEHRHPHELAGGEQQRVALARAMVVQPKVLLFDEPLSNLDAKLRGAMRAEIRRAQHMLGITGLYVTHDQEEAMSMSDRIVVMHRGRIAQIGTPAEIYLRPASVFVADFIGRANFLEVPAEPDRGHAIVTAFGKKMAVPSHPDVTAHDTALLMIRPEVLSVAHASREGEGVILNRTFHGASVDYEIETAGGTVTAAVPAPHPAVLLTEGTPVTVTFAPDRAYVLPRR
ncbi:ABC transporter ATP-binding protein [Sinosporangium siamense]|uniref:Spermidine/putrescine import ATP-binding protein PotA n=1 Tax=Sinosporangium siamense TaxID=1367973 RepID=A0A919RJZ8_9ACTN|nr:ABC transporter ATP-binding protein [Sinosporangium siamense]GII95033.1 spermidine/putrescine import ATP-binding protein PotA [Sinosporangium siamense]